MALSFKQPIQALLWTNASIMRTPVTFAKIIIICNGIVLLSSCQQTSENTASMQVENSSQFLHDLQERTFHYFWDLTDHETGLVPDRAPTASFSSVAATGFGLTAYIVGVERDFISREEAATRVLNTLKFHYEAPQGEQVSGIIGYKGFFYHFLDPATGHRFKEVELSTIDTGLLMAGILSCQSYFNRPNATEKAIRELADKLYRRVEWDWALNDNGTLSMGWFPEKGFIEHSWQGYNEAMILLVLAIASPTHPIPAESWTKWTKTYRWANFQGYEYVNFGPLFGHQYSHMYVDFRGIQDEYMRSKGIDYFENSKRATLANRAYCIENPGGFIGYGPDLWGLTACDGPFNGEKETAIGAVQFAGYWARAAAINEIRDDGTIAPTAAGGSLAFTPQESLAALMHMKNEYGDRLYGEYGFKDAFNLTYPEQSGWFDKDYLGIDQGPILIQAENYRTELIWSIMKENPYIVEGLKKAGFTGGWL